jgi:hypothetical protein
MAGSAPRVVRSLLEKVEEQAVTPTVRRGRWQHYTGVVPYAAAPVAAWQLEDTGWWLRRRTGAMESLRFCSYCYYPPYAWWQLYRVPPDEWLIHRSGYWDRWQSGHGICTHRHLLTEAMPAVERAYDKHILETLAKL